MPFAVLVFPLNLNLLSGISLRSGPSNIMKRLMKAVSLRRIYAALLEYGWNDKTRPVLGPGLRIIESLT